MMDIKAVCFDIDGTMYPKWMTHLFLVPTLFGSLSLMHTIQKFRKYMRSGDDVIIVPANEDGFRQKQIEFILQSRKKEITKGSVEQLRRRLDRQFYKRMEKTFSHIVSYPNLEKVMLSLKAKNLLIGALSDFPIEKKLEHLGVAHLVNWAGCTEMSGYLKPHPAPFEYVSERIKVPLNQILYVGDSYTKDIIGAHNAGMYTALLLPHARGKKSKERYPLADILFSDYEELERNLSTLIP
jgi:putative hydrolase of the HAD superfamily